MPEGFGNSSRCVSIKPLRRALPGSSRPRDLTSGTRDSSLWGFDGVVCMAAGADAGVGKVTGTAGICSGVTVVAAVDTIGAVGNPGGARTDVTADGAPSGGFAGSA